MAVKQKPVRLDQPIDHSAPPTIYGSKLTPELATAALNLTIDFQRQKQSTANIHILQHPITLGAVLLASGAYGYYKVGWIYQRGGLELVKANNDVVFGVLIFAIMFACIFFSIASRPTSIIKDNADALVTSSETVFGMDLREFINIDPNGKASKELLAKGENTEIIIYRDTPIAVMSLMSLPKLSNHSKFVVKITGCGVRKVYQKSGILEDLFDWSFTRAGKMNNNKAESVLVLIEALSIDNDLKKVLKAKGFQHIESKALGDSWILKRYGLMREVWAVSLNVVKMENIESKKGASGASRKA